MERDLEQWLDHPPELECDWEPLRSMYRRSLVDLAALRFSPATAGKRSLPAAGLPWFMTMFGRDSIFTNTRTHFRRPQGHDISFAPEGYGGTCG
jgi:glycogen debranching enzyme